MLLTGTNLKKESLDCVEHKHSGGASVQIFNKACVPHIVGGKWPEVSGLAGHDCLFEFAESNDPSRCFALLLCSPMESCENTVHITACPVVGRVVPIGSSKKGKGTLKTQMPCVELAWLLVPINHDTSGFTLKDALPVAQLPKRSEPGGMTHFIQHPHGIHLSRFGRRWGNVLRTGRTCGCCKHLLEKELCGFNITGHAVHAALGEMTAEMAVSEDVITSKKVEMDDFRSFETTLFFVKGHVEMQNQHVICSDSLNWEHNESV